MPSTIFKVNADNTYKNQPVGSGRIMIEVKDGSILKRCFTEDVIDIEFNIINRFNQIEGGSPTQALAEHNRPFLGKTHCDGIVFTFDENVPFFVEQEAYEAVVEASINRWNNAIGEIFSLERNENGEYIYENGDHKNSISIIPLSDTHAFVTPYADKVPGEDKYFYKRHLKISDADILYDLSTDGNDVELEKVHMLTTLQHEFGHSLGLEHEINLDMDNPTSIDGENIYNFSHNIIPSLMFGPSGFCSDIGPGVYCTAINIDEASGARAKKGALDILSFNINATASDQITEAFGVVGLNQDFSFTDDDLVISSLLPNKAIISINRNDFPLNYTVDGPGFDPQFISSTNDNEVIIALPPEVNNGSYCLTFTDDLNGCGPAKICFDLVGCNQAIQETFDDTYSCQTDDGIATITMNITGGLPPYEVLWTFGENVYTGTTISGNFGVGGYFFYTLTDASGCIIDDNYLHRYIPPIVNSSIVPFCSNTSAGETGLIDLTISKGAQPYSFQWSSGETTEDLTNITTSGTYTVTVTDDCGTVKIETYELGIYSTKDLTTYINSPSNCFASDGGVYFFDMPFSGGVPPYSYQWNTGATTLSIQDLSGGTYFLTITDSEGCEQEFEFILNEQGAPIIELVEKHDACEGLGDGSIAILPYTAYDPNTPVASYEVTWFDEAGNVINGTEDGVIYEIANLTSGLYTVEVEDITSGSPNNGCMSTSIYEIDEIPSTGVFMVTSSVTNTCINENTGNISLTVSGGNPPYSYSWSNGASTSQLNNLSSNNYAYTVTDNCGRTFSSSQFIGIFPEMNSAPPVIGGCPGEISLNITGGTPPYSYYWSNGQTTSTASNLLNGVSYCVTVTDAGGCSIENCYDVPVDESAFDINLSYIQHLTYVNQLGLINVSPSPVSDNYTYQWSTGSTESYMSTFTYGTFTVTVTNSTGCSIVGQYELTDCSNTTEVPGFEISATGGMFISYDDLETTVTVLIKEDNGLGYLSEEEIENDYSVRWEHSNGDIIGNSITQIVTQASIPNNQLYSDGFTNIRLFVSNGCEEKELWYVLFVCGEVDEQFSDDVFSKAFLSNATIDEPCEGFNDGSIELIIPSSENTNVTVTKSGVPLTLIDDGNYYVALDLGLSAGTYDYVVTIGECENSFSYVLENEPTTLEYDKYENDLCIYKEFCDDLQIGTFSEPPNRLIAEAAQWPTCRVPLYCDDPEEQVGFDAYNRRTITGFEYRRILAHMIQQGGPFDPEYLAFLSLESNSIGDCDPVIYCPATMEVSATGLSNVINDVSVINSGGCSQVNCTGLFDIPYSFHVCDDDLNVPESLLNFEEGGSSCDIIQANVFELYNAYENNGAFSDVDDFLFTELAGFLLLNGEKPQAKCATVIYCANDFTKVYDNIDLINCNEFVGSIGQNAPHDPVYTCIPYFDMEDPPIGDQNTVWCTVNGYQVSHIIDFNYIPPQFGGNQPPDVYSPVKHDINSYSANELLPFSFIKHGGIRYPKGIIRTSNDENIHHDYYHKEKIIRKKQVGTLLYYFDDWDESETILCYETITDQTFQIEFISLLSNWSKALTSTIKLQIDKVSKDNDDIIMYGYYEGNLSFDGSEVSSNNSGSSFILVIDETGTILSIITIENNLNESNVKVSERKEGQTLIAGNYSQEEVIINDQSLNMPTNSGAFVSLMNDVQQVDIFANLNGIEDIEILDISGDSTSSYTTIAVKLGISSNPFKINNEVVASAISSETIFIISFYQNQMVWWYRILGEDINTNNLKLAIGKERDVFALFPFSNSIQLIGGGILQSEGGTDIGVVKLDGFTGNLELSRSYGSINDENISDIFYSTEADAVVFGGEYISSNTPLEMGEYILYTSDGSNISKSFIALISDNNQSFSQPIGNDVFFQNRPNLDTFEVFPNPFKGHISTRISSDTPSNYSLILTDLLGKEIISQKGKLNKGINFIDVKTQHLLRNGVYILSYYKDGVFFSSEKIISQN